MCCPASMGLPRTVPNRGGGVTIGGRTFAPGTILSINPWVIHHSTEIWGADAAEFHPERWLVGDVAHIAALEKYFMPVSDRRLFGCILSFRPSPFVSGHLTLGICHS